MISPVPLVARKFLSANVIFVYSRVGQEALHDATVDCRLRMNYAKTLGCKCTYTYRLILCHVETHNCDLLAG